MSTKIKHSPVRLEKLNSPYVCIEVGLGKGKNAMCFLSSNISVFPKKNPIFSISRPGINLASPNGAYNRPFSFHPRVAFIACRKVVIQPSFCITLPCSKKRNCRKTVSNYLAVNKSRVKRIDIVTMCHISESQNILDSDYIRIGLPIYIKFGLGK